MVLLDPRKRPTPAHSTNLLALLKDWGIEAGDQVVINMPADYTVKEGEALDIAQLGALPNTDGTFVLAGKYLQHPMTAGLGRVTVVFRLARSVTAIDAGRQQSFPAEHHRDDRDELGRVGREAPVRQRPGRARSRQGGQGRPAVARRRGLGSGAGRLCARRRRIRPTRRRRRRRASRCSATPTSRRTSCWAPGATPISS